MKVLAVDTSSKVATIALCNETEIIAEFSLNHKMTHSQQLMPMIEYMLKMVDTKPSDVDLFAVAVGPGSFTGLRIGVTTLKTLAFALNKPIVGVNTLEALTYNIQPGDCNVCAMLDARNNQVFAGIFVTEGNKYKLNGEYIAIEVESLLENVKNMKIPTLFVGDGANLYQDYIKGVLGDLYRESLPYQRLQRASTIAQIAIEKSNNNQLTNSVDLLPFYLRKSQAEQEYDRRKGEKIE